MSFNIGDKVVLLRDNSIGTVRFVGYTEFKAGEWVGIELDQQFKSNGKNDGSIQGIRYFTCENRDSDTNGVFVRPTMIIKPNAENMPDVGNDKAAKLQGILGRLDHKVMILMKDITNLKKALKDSEVEKNQLNMIINTLQDNLEKELVEKSFVQSENDGLQLQLDELKNKYDKVYKEISDLREELNLMHEINEAADNSGERSGGDIELKTRNKMLEKALVTLKDEYANSEIELNEKLLAMQQKLDQLSHIEEKYSHCLEELEIFERNNKLLKDKLDTLSESESIIDSLIIKNEELSDKIVLLENKVEELEQLELIEQDLDKNRTELERESKTYIKKLQDELNNKKSEISSLKSRNEKLEYLLTNLKQSQSTTTSDDEASRPHSEEVAKLKHENSKLLKLKSDLALQVLLKKINEDSVSSYTGFISKFSQSSKFDDYFTLFKFRSICSNLYDYFKSFVNISTVRNAEQYSSSSRALHQAYDFQALLIKTDSLIEISSYVDIPTHVIKPIKDYSADFEKSFESQSFEINLPKVTTELAELSFRESSIVNTQSALLKFEYSYELLNLIESGLRMARIAYKVSCQDLKDSLKNSVTIITPFCEKLTKLRGSNNGIAHEIKIDDFSDQADNIIDCLREIDLSLEFMDVEVPNSVHLPDFYDFSLPELKSMQLPIQRKWERQQTSKVISSTLVKRDSHLVFDQHGMVENLSLKLNLLQTKLRKFQDNELKSIELKSELNDKLKENESLQGKLQNAEDLQSEMETRINVLRSKMKIYGINENNTEVDNIREEFTNLDQLNMINEITQLRDLVKRLKCSKTNFISNENHQHDWLREEPVLKFHQTIQAWNRLDSLIQLNFMLNDQPECEIDNTKEAYSDVVSYLASVELEMAKYRQNSWC